MKPKDRRPKNPAEVTAPLAAPTVALSVALLDEARRRQPELLELLRGMVEIESPSDDKAAVDRCVAFVELACVDAGGTVKRHRQRKFGDLLQVRFAGNSSRKTRPLLLLGHLDTVWPVGTLATMPFRVKNGRIWGPGVLDMKAGVAMALIAMRIVQDGNLLRRPVVLLLNSEEEVGSPCSRRVTEKLAQAAKAVFVMEPAQGPDGAYKTARKGVGDFRLRVTGVAAHSGIDFARGHSAVAELARQIERIGSFTDLDRGLTVNVGVVGGGTRSNVVAAEAWAHIDVRIANAKDAAGIERRLRSLRPFDQGCRLAIEGGINRPPMERSAATARLFKRAATLAESMGFSLKEAATGGASDGNFTAALGIPTLDGMGAVGEGAHARNESVRIEHLAPRTALLAAMISNSGSGAS